jgi:hypothetical protein
MYAYATLSVWHYKKKQISREAENVRSRNCETVVAREISAV